MKALSIKQPWASLIAHGIKDIENRTWATKYRGTIYIHASSKPSFSNLTLNLTHDQIDQMVLGDFCQLDSRSIAYPKSAIIGTVDIVDCVINHPSIWAEKTEGITDCNTKEFIPNRNKKPIYNWVLANPVLFEKPILNVKGKLSLWEFDRKEVSSAI
ncbi:MULTISPECIES: ASCH domain-containing protein [Sphingobacterium]|uniref:ASCH domain-containing protein n=1 Tax=Sphingobacterium TaxID=28453 RepID=UPI00257C9493|nr:MULTISPECIES: ASCH domain-containing protein [Sphingobacterium]